MDNLDAILADRGKVYGDPLENHKGIALMWAPLLQPHAEAIARMEPLPPWVVSLLMVALKIDRMRLVYREDNFSDAHNYLRFTQDWQKPTTPAPVGPAIVYLCGPITGRREDFSWREGAESCLSEFGIQCLNPLRGKDPSKIGNGGLDYDGKPAPVEMVDQDLADVARATVLLAHFPYPMTRNSTGSTAEITAAGLAGKEVVLVDPHGILWPHLFARRFCTPIACFADALRYLTLKHGTNAPAGDQHET